MVFGALVRWRLLMAELGISAEKPAHTNLMQVLLEHS